MSNTPKILSLLGLAQRAGRVVSGEEFVVEAIQKRQATLVFLAHDAASNLQKKMTDKCKTYQVYLAQPFSAEELSMAIGKSRKVIAVTDQGFAKKMRSMME